MKILIIEDEYILASDLKEILTAEGYEVVCIADNGKKAIDFYQQNDVDLVLCDISIYGDWDGIETVQRLMALKLVPVIYITSLTDEDTIERAKKTFPAAYIPKPFHITNLRMAIEMAINNFAFRVNNVAENSIKIVRDEKDITSKEMILQINDDVFIKQNYQFVKFPLSEILYLEADLIYTKIITLNKKYIIRQTITNVFDRLPLKNLVKIHRSYVVNINQLDSFSESEVVIKGNILPLSRTFKEEFMNQFRFR
jgi:two-component system, response regulator PdtaR